MNIDTNFDYIIRIALLGDSRVGKTNMIVRFVDNTFSYNIPSTMGYDCKSKIISIGKKKVKVQIWDTVGQERYLSINKSFLQKLDGVMLVYDISELESFQNMKNWINIVKDFKDKMPIIIVGNKKDKEEERIVSEEEGENLAKENETQFFETSACNGENIEKTFSFFSGKVFNYLMEEKKLANDNFTLEKPDKSKNNHYKKICCK